MIPPKLDIFHGREPYVEDAVTSITSQRDGVRVAIMGPGGMGKTSVSLAIINDSRVIEHFERSWIQCEQATSIPLLTLVIAKSLDIKAPSNDPLKDVQLLLQQSEKPRLLIFDNFETPMYIGGMSTIAETVLQTVAACPNVSVLLTMRGRLRPCRNMKWTAPLIPPLKSISLDAAYRTFVEINPEVEGDPNVYELIEMLDCVPLSVAIVASLSQVDETPLQLIERLKEEKTALIELYKERVQSIDFSIKLSLTSPPMKDNPEAHILLHILSMLPGGAKYDRLGLLAPGLKRAKAAFHTLKRVSLATIDHKQIIHVLSPISSHILEHYELEASHRQQLYQYYFTLAARSNCAEKSDFLQIKLEMADEEANMDNILLDALAQEGDLVDAIKAAVNYTWFLNAHVPRLEVILKAIQVIEASGKPEHFALLSDCLSAKGAIKLKMKCYEEAIDDLTRVQGLCVDRRDEKGVAECLWRLSGVLRELGYFSEARAHLQDSLARYKAIGDDLGVARCFQSLGEVLSKQHQYEGARSNLLDAKKIFADSGNVSGVAQCLRGMGDALSMQDRLREAQASLEEARKISEGLGDVLEAALCLRSLGDVFSAQRQFDEAYKSVEEARIKFEDVGNADGVAQCLTRLRMIADQRSRKTY